MSGSASLEEPPVERQLWVTTDTDQSARALSKGVPSDLAFSLHIDFMDVAYGVRGSLRTSFAQSASAITPRNDSILDGMTTKW